MDTLATFKLGNGSHVAFWTYVTFPLVSVYLNSLGLLSCQMVWLQIIGITQFPHVDRNFGIPRHAGVNF